MAKVGDIALNSGVTISCKSIRQWRTYSGLLEGLAGNPYHDRRFHDAMERMSKARDRYVEQLST